MQRIFINKCFLLREFSAWMVPWILTDDQKQCQPHISSDLLHNAEMFDRVITGDETWCFQYNLETKRQSMQWKTQNSPPSKRARVSCSQFKTMLVCFFDHKGIVCYAFVVQGQMVNQQCYWKCWQGYGNLFGGKGPNSGLTSGFSTMTMPLHMMH
jgi:hypothetical protein